MSLPRHWRLRDTRYRLVGARCTACGERMLPAREICPHCRTPGPEPYTFSGKGRVYSHTTVYEAPTGYEGSVPFTLALVRLDEGPLVTAQLTDIDPGQTEIDQRVEMVTRKLREHGPQGLIVYGYKFRPLLLDTL